MKRYTGSITFLYYNDFLYGIKFVEEILDLELVMDQGWARVYKISEKGFLGVVKKDEKTLSGDTLISLNTLGVEQEYSRISNQEVFELSELKFFESIPLKSFFFNDKEGHRFEIQEFLKEEDKELF